MGHAQRLSDIIVDFKRVLQDSISTLLTRVESIARVLHGEYADAESLPQLEEERPCLAEVLGIPVEKQ